MMYIVWSLEQMVKEFRRKLAPHVALLRIKSSLLLHVLIDDRMIPFCCVQRSRDSQCFSTPQIARSRGGISTSPSTWFLVPTRVSKYTITFQSASRSVQPFLQGSRTWPTNIQPDTQTDHATYSVCSNRLHSASRCYCDAIVQGCI